MTGIREHTILLTSINGTELTMQDAVRAAQAELARAAARTRNEMAARGPFLSTTSAPLLSR